MHTEARARTHTHDVDAVPLHDAREKDDDSLEQASQQAAQPKFVSG